MPGPVPRAADGKKGQAPAELAAARRPAEAGTPVLSSMKSWQLENWAAKEILDGTGPVSDVFKKLDAELDRRLLFDERQSIVLHISSMLELPTNRWGPNTWERLRVARLEMAREFIAMSRAHDRHTQFKKDVGLAK